MGTDGRMTMTEWGKLELAGLSAAPLDGQQKLITVLVTSVGVHDQRCGDATSIYDSKHVGADFSVQIALNIRTWKVAYHSLS